MYEALMHYDDTFEALLVFTQSENINSIQLVAIYDTLNAISLINGKHSDNYIGAVNVARRSMGRLVRLPINADALTINELIDIAKRDLEVAIHYYPHNTLPTIATGALEESATMLRWGRAATYDTDGRGYARNTSSHPPLIG